MGKTKCRCGKKVSGKFEFCPYCGQLLDKEVKDKKKGKESKDKQKDALLDEVEQIEKAFNIPFFMKPVVRQLAKQIDRQFQDMDKMIGKDELSEKDLKNFKIKGIPIDISGISINIASDGEGPPVIKVSNFGKGAGAGAGMKIPGAQPERQNIGEKQQKLPARKINEKEQEKFSRLPHVEPGTRVRRLTDRIIYEIELPGVKEKDVIISKLENSIEVKAFSKDKAFFKLIPIPLRIKRYYMEEGKLIIEFLP